MFKIRDIQLGTEYTDTDLANALMDVVAYSYGDRIGDGGYDIATIPAEGAADSGVVAMGPIVLATRPDATMFITDYASGKMGVVPLSTAEATFVTNNAALMARIATLLGYADYVVYTLTHPASGEQSRLVWSVMNFDFGTSRGETAVKVYTDNAADTTYRGIYHSPDTSAALFTAINTEGLGNMTAPNGIVAWNVTQVRIPLEYYLTDTQNVQDAARKTVQYNAIHSDEQDAVMTQAFGSVAALVGSLSVFGDSVKNVTERYNSVTQYIPRP